MVVADSECIRDYLVNRYKVATEYISYGADIFTSPNPLELVRFNLQPQSFFLLIARMQSDNNIEEIIKGVLHSDSDFPLLIIGDVTGNYGRYLEQAYSSERIRFLGPIFDKETLDQLRYHSRLYFHGHSSGGTNPSLLEAMAASATICAHDNPFSREVLGSNAFYFSHNMQVAETIKNLPEQNIAEKFVQNNIDRIKSAYALSLIHI